MTERWIHVMLDCRCHWSRVLPTDPLPYEPSDVAPCPRHGPQQVAFVGYAIPLKEGLDAQVRILTKDPWHPSGPPEVRHHDNGAILCRYLNRIIHLRLPLDPTAK